MEQPFVGAKTLEDAFPDIAVGDEFNRVFESHTAESDQFAVFVIRVDNFQKRLEQLGENITSQVILRLAKIIDGLSQTSSMKWGRLSQDRFGCACLDMDQADAVQLAEEMQRRLALAGKETVSIGLGVHPFRPFEETNTLSNAEKALDHAAFFGPDTVTAFDAVSLNISADKLYQHGDIDGTIEELTKALMLDPENVNVHNSLGVCYGVQDKLALAAESFETARRLDPKDMMAVYNLGLAHLKQDSKATALELFLEAHGIDGANPDVTYQIGMCYREIDQKDAAIGIFS